MSVSIQHRFSNTAGKVPTPANLSVRELAVNTADGIVYTKTNSGAVVPINPPMYNARLVTVNGGTIAITFASGKFAAAPVVTATVECPSADQSNYVYVAELVGPVTTTGCTIKVMRIPTQLSVLVLGTLTIAAAAPAGIYVNVSAETAI